MRARIEAGFFAALFVVCALRGKTVPNGLFDAAPYGIRLPGGEGVMWEDPREIHWVRADFSESVPVNARVRLEYWGSHWPKEHLPKDREPGGGDTGWMELGNWS